MEFTEVEFESARLLFTRIRGETHGQVLNTVVCETFETLHPWMVWAKEKPSVSETINGLKSVTDDYKSFVFAVVDKETKKLIGLIGLHNAKTRKIEYQANTMFSTLGYWLHKDFCGKGLCTEGVKRVMEYGALELGVKHFTLTCNEKNFASRRVAEKCGFAYVDKYEQVERQDWGNRVSLCFQHIVE